MRLLVVAVGQRVPDWAQTAWDDYAKRFPPEMRLELKAVKTEPRASRTLAALLAAERERIEAAIPRGARIVALEQLLTYMASRPGVRFMSGEQIAAHVAGSGMAPEGDPFAPHEATLAIEGPGWLLADFPARWADPARREQLLTVLRWLKAEPSLLGASAHLLAVGRKPASS